jgi:hypothetical protein
MGRVISDFISDIDKKLAEFDATHPKTASQQEEIDKYARIHTLRDTPVDQPEPEENIWDF